MAWRDGRTAPVRKRSVSQAPNHAGGPAPRHPDGPAEPPPERGRTPGPRAGVGLYRYVAARSLRHQLALSVLVATSAGLAVIPIEMQKRIVNEAIGARSLPALAWYGVAFVVAALAVTTSKLAINIYQGYVAERLLRDFRAELYDRILRLPADRLARTPPAQLVSIVLAEAGELAEFFGHAFSLPLVSGFTLIAVTAYLATLNVWTLALLALHPLEIWVIPRLQERVNRFSRSRVVLGRHLSEHVMRAMGRRAAAEPDAIDEAADRRRFRRRLDRLLGTRVRASVFSSLIKWVGNAMAKLGPFLIFVGGGWLIITRPDTFDLGRLVAALAAYDRLNEPWQELLDYYSLKESAITRYAQITASVSTAEGPGL